MDKKNSDVYQRLERLLGMGKDSKSGDGKYRRRMRLLFGIDENSDTQHMSRRERVLLKKLGEKASKSDENEKSGGSGAGFVFNANADAGDLASLDVATQLPKLSEKQISDIIGKHFSKSTVIKPSDAAGIFNAQQNTGMSALAILGIGALESGYGTSNIAKQKNNIWGWNATNVNPGGNATAFSQMSQGAQEFASKYMNTYYNKYGAKSISAAGTGNNPAGKGYAYYDNGSINPTWATSIGSIMKNFYNTAKGN